MEAKGWRALDPPRPLTARERATLDVLLAEAFRGRDGLRRQAATARVAEECPCGCGSIRLVVDRDPLLRAEVNCSVPVEGHSTVPAVDGAPIEVLLPVVGGYLDEIEVVPYTEAVRWPDPETLVRSVKGRE